MGGIGTVNLSKLEDLLCLVVGSGLVVGGVSLISPAAAVMTAGLLLLANAFAGDLKRWARRPGRR